MSPALRGTLGRMSQLMKQSSIPYQSPPGAPGDGQVLIPGLPALPLWLPITVLAVLVVAAFILGFVLCRGGMSLLISDQKRKLSEERGRGQALRNEMQANIDSLTQELELNVRLARKYHAVRANLEAAPVVKDFVQPVVLIGPRFVGKTSLVNQLRAPWIDDEAVSTTGHRSSTLPFYDEKLPRLERHFADNEIMTDVIAHLQLRFHDLPGELGYQDEALAFAEKETNELREQLQIDLGVVLVCMLDATEALTGISDATRAYYNDELLAKLRDLVRFRKVKIQRLIFVFNKVDLALNRSPGMNLEQLKSNCVATFASVVKPFGFIPNPDRVCEVLTVLTQEDRQSNRGSSLVVGECAVGIVQAVFGRAAVGNIVTERASSSVSVLWPGVV